MVPLSTHTATQHIGAAAGRCPRPSQYCCRGLTNICTKTMPGWAGLGWAGPGWAGWAGGKVSPGRVTQHSGARVTGGRGRAAGDSRERERGRGVVLSAGIVRSFSR